MTRFELEETSNTPHILFDGEAGKFIIEGKSFPEDSKEFYRRVIDWMEQYKTEKPATLALIFNLFYLSSSSIISVKQLLLKLVDLQNAGTKVSVTWKYDHDDDDIKKTGEDYQQLTKLNFVYKVNV
jgi:hypothetical protein